ncbi:TrmH family RNA methyltransferase [Planctomonas psychrotolerans]|uniref:TrmH family RNA methyltransferase n=1 Tax=Planctomonas psychrotolerans TaxID=2528712 RepID=UPI00123A920C|nr:RNA methyltransferase [Planctomonas psychrotolerans]
MTARSDRGPESARPAAEADRIVPITDLTDPRLGDYAHHTDVALRKARGSEHGLYIAESALVLRRAVDAGHVPRSVLCLGGSVDEALEILTGFPEVPVFVGPAELLADLTGYLLHRGLIAAMHRPASPDPRELLRGARRVVVLENVADPTNVGAIFRSVGAIGADAVLITPRCSDPYYRRAIRVSMGTVLQVPWARVGDWEATGPLLEQAGFSIAALALSPTAVPLREYAANAPERLAVVLGAEGDGLTPAALDAAHTLVQIPMLHGIDSLNVAAASAVAMWALAPNARTTEGEKPGNMRDTPGMHAQFAPPRIHP